MMDLDEFKAINDRYGHVVGYAALVQFSKTLRTHVRRAEAIARLGGDEFVLVLPRTRGVDGLRVLERPRDVLTKSPLLIREEPVSLNFSAGVAEQRAGESLSDALVRADAALLDAKRCGKDATRVDIPQESLEGTLLERPRGVA